MRFLDLYIKGFGKFHDTFVSFEDGLNLVYGKNEAGKSTIHTFIRGMLFGIERQRGRAAKNDLYSKYEPWENSSTYEGQLRLESGGVIYRFERSFQKNKKEFTIINETAGREMEPTKALLDEILCGLSETAYNNTISIGQLKSSHGRRHDLGAEKLYCQHEHHRQYFLKYHKSDCVFEKPEEAV